VKNAVMAKEYPGQNAFSVNELDIDDTTAITAQYAEMITQETALLSINYEEIRGQHHLDDNYIPRLPIPTDCLNSIEAAFYLYGREGLENSVYLMAHGYVWVFNPNTKEMLPGYPKRLGLVFYGAPAQIDAAFDTGALIHLIAGNRVIIYKVTDGAISYNIETTLQDLFGITDKIKAAFNNKKVECSGNSDTNCIKTTLVVDAETEDSKYYEVIWKKRGKKFENILGGQGTKVIGSALKNNLFGAAYEYTTDDGTTEVMIFQRLGRTMRSRVIFPGVNYEERDGYFDVPGYFSIVGWCVDA